MEELPPYRSPKLTEEEIQQQMKRLTTRPARRSIHDPFPLCPSIKLPKEKLDRVTQRVYYEQIQRHEAVIREAEEKRKMECGRSSVSMPADEVDGLVKRVYYDAIERDRIARQAAQERLLFRSTKKIPKIPLSKFVEDMYVRGIEREEKKKARLYEKYILPTEIRSSKLPRDVIEESGRRLTTRSVAG